MLWRVRTNLPDRPGALAVLAQHCGDAGVNILGLQVFPGVEAVTDELVLRTPPGWSLEDIAALVGRSGGEGITGGRCTEAALVDQPARYVQAARAILAQPASFPEVVARLFDAEADPVAGSSSPEQDVMEMTVGEVRVQVRRAARFTQAEHARGAAMADVVGDVLARAAAESLGPSPGRRLGVGAAPAYAVDGETVAAVVDGTTVGLAALRADTVEAGVRAVTLRVDPAWQRRGVGSRLLTDVARLAAGLEVREIVLTTSADNRAVLPMVLAAGLRGRIRLAGERLTVRIAVHELKPLEASRLV